MSAARFRQKKPLIKLLRFQIQFILLKLEQVVLIITDKIKTTATEYKTKAESRQPE